MGCAQHLEAGKVAQLIGQGFELVSGDVKDAKVA